MRSAVSNPSVNQPYTSPNNRRASSRLLATGICLVPQRHPLVLAKAVATLDHYANGRVIFGVGAGWFREEAALFGVDFSRRWVCLRESVEAMRALWTQEAAEYHGEYIDFPPVQCLPQPVQKPQL